MNVPAPANRQVQPDVRDEAAENSCVIEAVSGMNQGENAGTPSSIFEKSIWPTLVNIAAPTMMSTAAVANGATMPASGAKKKHAAERHAGFSVG